MSAHAQSAGGCSLATRRARTLGRRAPARVQATAASSGLQPFAPKEDTVQLGASSPPRATRLLHPHVRTTATAATLGRGDQYWGFGGDYGEAEVAAAYAQLVPAGLTFLDSAEVYGLGKSEELTGRFVRAAGQEAQVQIATKFAPLPWRLGAAAVPAALRDSLARLGVPRVALYICHWPGVLGLTDAYVDGLADCQLAGLTQAVGVSNFNAERVRSAAARLRARGVPLSSNQIQYSLLYRTPESNGVIDACREVGVTVVAYSPLAQGLLTGKYVEGGARPVGPRAAIFSDDKLRSISPLLGLMREVGAGHGGKTPAQVALNWVVCKGAVPIPGVKTARQAAEVAGALGWRLTAEEVAALDRASQPLSRTAFGAPMEQW